MHAKLPLGQIGERIGAVILTAAMSKTLAVMLVAARVQHGLCPLHHHRNAGQAGQQAEPV